jgi:dTMP kinase
VKLIAIEGVDGAGTTTQTQRLAAHFDLYPTREPSDLAIGKLLRSVLRHEIRVADERAVALLFAADRLDHVTEEIEPTLTTRHVITDRYILSSIVYQSLRVDRDFVVAINARARLADLTILVDVPAEIAAARRAGRGGSEERYDHDDTQRRLVEAYRAEIKRVPNGVVVDGSGSADDVFARLVPLVRSCLDDG